MRKPMEWMGALLALWVPAWVACAGASGDNQDRAVMEEQQKTDETGPGGIARAYQIYYGALHNHTAEMSDGEGSVEEAYDWARNTMELDFFGLADHSDNELFTPRSFRRLKSTADRWNRDGDFVTFWGFEWTNPPYGHVAVVQPTTYCTAGESSAVDPQDERIDTLVRLVRWMERRAPSAVAFFNHPTSSDEWAYSDRHEDEYRVPGRNFVGIEMWNGRDGLDVYFDSPARPLERKLRQGWRLGVGGSFDRHAGYREPTSVRSRLAVLAEQKTRASLLEALTRRRFFTTEDRNLALFFRAAGQPMGAEIPLARPSSVDFEIEAWDRSEGGERFADVLIIKNGDRDRPAYRARSDSTRVSVRTALTCAPGDFFYAVVSEEDSDRAIASPIFFVQGVP